MKTQRSVVKLIAADAICDDCYEDKFPNNEEFDGQTDEQHGCFTCPVCDATTCAHAEDGCLNCARLAREEYEAKVAEQEKKKAAAEAILEKEDASLIQANLLTQVKSKRMRNQLEEFIRSVKRRP